MNAEDKMIEAIRNKNRQIEMMLEKKRAQAYSSSDEEEQDQQQEGEYEDEGEYAEEGEEDEEEDEQENYYQQIKKMQLRDDYTNQYKNNRFEEDKYAEEQQQESSDEEVEQQLVYNHEQKAKPPQQEESDNEDDGQAYGGMQSKFMGYKVESACMFDEDEQQEKPNVNSKYNKNGMEPIQEGYSSDDSFGAQQKQKNLKENLKFILKENSKKNASNSDHEAETNARRNHINVKTSMDEKENINSRNKKLEEKRTAPDVLHSKPKSESLKRPGTAKMKSSSGFKTALLRPQTAKVPKSIKRPTTAKMSSSSTIISSKKSLKQKMFK